MSAATRPIVCRTTRSKVSMCLIIVCVIVGRVTSPGTGVARCVTACPSQGGAKPARVISCLSDPRTTRTPGTTCGTANLYTTKGAGSWGTA